MNEDPSSFSKIPFTKPWLPFEKQLEKLKARGLKVLDEPKALAFLSHVNYYRLSGYCLAFEKPDSNHCFLEGVRFDQVQHSYEFDLTIRDLISEALEIIEVDIRTSTSYHFGEKYGPYGHTEKESFFPHPKKTTAKDWLDKVNKEVHRSKELFVRHFEKTYTRFPEMPVWVTMEVMSFGLLSQMIALMVNDDIAKISNRYKIKPETFKAWTHHLSHVRNLCAHHCRLWDKIWSVKAVFPKSHEWSSLSFDGQKKLAGTLLIIYRMLLCCPTIGNYAAVWKSKVDGLLTTPPETPKAMFLMGMSNPLASNPIWNYQSAADLMPH